MGVSTIFYSLMNVFTIKDLENLSGIQAHTLRIWEQRYDFLKPQRSQTNIRFYSYDELKIVMNVALLNRFGYRISRISKMTPEERSEKILQLVPVEAVHEYTIHQMLEQMIDVDLDKFDALLTKTISQFGLKETVLDILFPFLQQIGILWSVGHINAAQEHFVTNIIRQKLLAETDQLNASAQAAQRVLLFLPEGEIHEIEILFIQYILKEKGIRNWYLGANVPVNDVLLIAKAVSPDFLYTHFTLGAQTPVLEKFIDQIKESLPKMHLIISGVEESSYPGKKFADAVRFIPTTKDAVHFINSLSA